MDPRRYETLKELFLKGRDLREPERSELVAGTRAEDPGLAAELERLLAADGEQEIERERIGLGEVAAREGAPWEGEAGPGKPEAIGWRGMGTGGQVPERIGCYRIVGVLGSGGMGIVYEAEQERPSRRVALKVIRPELITKTVLRRFELESEVLARLDHPGIARIFESGTTGPDGSGLPYFSMELVRGKTLTEAAASRQLGLEARLELMAKVADAVDHAHRQGVIHRDLKPGNILVGESLEPKILDFGVARFAADGAPESATLGSELLGTVATMSPEQARGQSTKIGPWTDVYALGVVTFELLCCELPHPVSGESLPAALRIIAEAEPLPLSRFRPELRGDVETILAKALAREPAARYGSAAEFAAELRRFLRHDPIHARPPHRLYLLSRFVRRHRGLTAGLALSVVLLVGGTVATSILAWKADVERQRADEEARRAKEETRRAATEARVAADTLEFMTGIFEAATPESSRGETITARTLLDRGVQRIDAQDFLDPRVRARLLLVMGRAYGQLALFAEGRALVDRALQSVDAFGTADATTRANALAAIAKVAMSAGKPAEALEPATEALLLISAEVPAADPRRLAFLVDLGIVLNANGRIDEAARELQDALSHLRTLEPTPRDQLSRCLSTLGAIFLERREPSAEALLTEALALRESSLPPDDPDLVDALNSLAVASMYGGRFDEAERLFRRALAIDTQSFPEAHPRRLRRMFNLAACLAQQGRAAEARPLMEDADAALQRSGAPDHPEFLKARLNIVRFLREAGAVERALTISTECLALAEGKLGEGHDLVADHHFEVAFTLAKLGRGGEALTHALRGAAIKEAVHGKDSVPAAEAQLYLAEFLRTLDRLEEAADAFDRAFAGLARRNQSGFERAYQGYAATLRSLERSEELEPLRKRFEAAKKEIP